MGDQVMTAIQDAAEQTVLLSMTYRAKDGKVSHRTVEPYEFKDGGLYAYDIAKRSIRKFLIDNILSADVMETKFSPRYPIKI